MKIKEMYELLPEFGGKLKEKGYLKDWADKNINVVKSFFMYLVLEINNIRLEDITEERARKYIKSFNEKGFARSTITVEIGILKRFIDYLTETKKLNFNNPFTNYNDMLGVEKKLKKEIPENLKWYLTSLRALNRSIRTIKGGQFILSPFFDYLEEKGIKEVSLITKNDIEEYLSMIYNEYGYSAKYRSIIIYFIKDYFKLAYERNLTGTDPAKKLVNPKIERLLPKDIPTDKEVKEIIMKIPEHNVRDRAIIEVLYGSGLRTSELTLLKLTDIDYEKKTLNVTDIKNKKTRIVPFNDITGYTLKEYIANAREKHIQCLSGRSPLYNEEKAREDSRKYLFVSNGGQALSPNMIRTILRKYVMKTGIKKNVTPHTLRHACGSEMLKGGAGIRFIQAMLGHEDINTTMIYTRIGIDDLKRIVDRMHPHGGKAC